MDAHDAIVIGSGMGGLACAAALARSGRRVLVLEQHGAAGGLTQTFSRDGFTWNVGMHYLGDMGPQGAARHVLDWLSGGEIRMASMGAVYDTLHFPDGFHMPMSRPEAALRMDLREHFPAAGSDIDDFLAAVTEAERAGRAIFAERAMPAPLGGMHRLWHRSEIDRWWGRTTARVLRETVRDPALRAVLAAQRGDYGDPSQDSSFGIHALVMRHYMDGAWYPIGGGRVFADSLLPVVLDAGGSVRTRAAVDALLVEHGAVVGVRLADGEEIRAAHVFSDAGALNTVGRLLPEAMRDSDWAREVLALQPSVCHVGLYLGFEGDIRACGATASNHWFYRSWALDAGLWDDPAHDERPGGMFVSFPTLKDPEHEPGERQRHTAEIVVMTRWDAFAPWAATTHGRRPADYAEFKARIERVLLDEFERCFPALAAMVVCHELSTPLSTTAFTGAPRGAIYGLETTPRRFLSGALRARTPIPGLFLAGQDVCTPGITGAMMGGILAAASLDPRIFAQMT